MALRNKWDARLLPLLPLFPLLLIIILPLLLILLLIILLLRNKRHQGTLIANFGLSAARTCTLIGPAARDLHHLKVQVLARSSAQPEAPGDARRSAALAGACVAPH